MQFTEHSSGKIDRECPCCGTITVGLPFKLLVTVLERQFQVVTTICGAPDGHRGFCKGTTIRSITQRVINLGHFSLEMSMETNR